MAIRSVFIFALFTLPFRILADDVKFTLGLSSPSITLQEDVQVQYTIENSGKVSGFTAPVFKNFTLVDGPNQVSGWSLQNGVLKEYTSFTFTLKPNREGRFLVPAATVKVNGKSYRSNEAWVEVSSSTRPTRTDNKNPSDEFVLQKGQSVQSKVRDNIFVTLDVNRESCYEGEPVIATYKLYTRLKSESKVTRRPSFSGFSVYDMADPESTEATREVYHGREYNVYLLRQVQLYPLQPGSLELEPMEVENHLSFIKADYLQAMGGLTSIMDALADPNTMKDGLVSETVTLSCNSKMINVKPLPDQADTSFQGGVGQFRIRTSVPGGTIHKNDVVNLVVEISGKGNFPVVPMPAIRWPDNVENYEASVTEQFNKFVCPISGSKIFTIPFSPKKEGPLNIPQVSFTYFDPQAGKYVKVMSESISLQVEPAKTIAPSQPKDIPIAPSPASAWKWILSAIGLITVFGGIYILFRQGQASKPSPVKPEVFHPQKHTEQNAEWREEPLDMIRSAFNEGDYKVFYRQLSHVVDDWMVKQYNADPIGNWKNTLSQKGVSPEMIREIDILKRDAAMAMYTPFVMESKMIEDLAKVERLMS